MTSESLLGSVSSADRPTPRYRLAVFFFVVAMPLGMWIVPLGNIMEAYGVGHLLPFVLACGGVSAFVSPLMIGSLADQRMAPSRVMAGLCVLTAVMLVGMCRAIETRAGTPVILSWAAAFSLASSPVWSLSSSIVLSQLSRPGAQFGPVRAWATVGWMAGGWVVSWVLHSDESVTSGYAAAAMWLVAAVWSLSLPAEKPKSAEQHRSWREVLGLDALSLLRNRDHRVVFLTAAAYSLPLAAFYPYCVIHLRDLEVPSQSAVLSLGQVTEVVVMLGLAGLMARFRLKWVFLAGISFGLLRYLLFALDSKAWVLVGIAIHGLAFTLYFITSQIYLEQRIDPAWRARAQALFSLLTNGIGHLFGFLACGWWYAACRLDDGSTDWSRFWSWLSLGTALVWAGFAWFYRGRKGESNR